MTKRVRCIRTTAPKKRRVFANSMEQRLRERVNALASLRPEDITPELWSNIESLEQIRKWESSEFGIEPIGSKARYTTTNSDFGAMLILLQAEITRLTPPVEGSAASPRKSLAVQLEESKARGGLLEKRLKVVGRERDRLSQGLESKAKTVRSLESLVDHYEQRVEALSRENSNLKARLFGLEGLGVVK
ncbi:hypothetical protein [Rhizobium indigoferae]|uniref:Uncharacterized protein n=1 Tax=Rhizobium indigoferae TaxID=158891 RepID=A0ABZ0ZDR8_9HYPH|nr:hypothetical protein [Rhizobium indigoferae]NNU56121.1 hypothetical protein [Rhizobium indigoferae]WQN37758.1 hypothetical protein U5G49_002897 [Rhizobium indigoferae]GLR59357.1 hypothetical protein GCM10007919_40840 [Rhizobium indigoferae]